VMPDVDSARACFRSWRLGDPRLRTLGRDILGKRFALAVK
jgi:hypothetical protein